jgi:protocatechuate 3,4-dioxygenase beta subunit
METETKLTRRASLLKLAGLAATAAGGSAALGRATAEGAGPAGVASGRISCVLTPELTEGPYYISDEAVRRDVTEGKPGTKLSLRTTVVSASTCKPIKNAIVEIWHADASGVYSGFGTGASNRTFLRGKQRSDRNGLAVFSTIYPGWYQGRTVHIHVKVWVGGNVVHTGQLFFPEATSDAVYAGSAYAGRGERDRHNSDDSIFVNGGSKGLLKTAKTATGYTGSITMGVMRG